MDPLQRPPSPRNPPAIQFVDDLVDVDRDRAAGPSSYDSMASRNSTASGASNSDLADSPSPAPSPSERAAGKAPQRPQHISLPPSPYGAIDENDNAIDDASTDGLRTPVRSGGTGPGNEASSLTGRARQMSFKKRGPGTSRASFLQRASGAAFSGRASRGSTGSAAGSEVKSKWKLLRRTGTASVHPPESVTGGGGDDPPEEEGKPSIPPLLPAVKTDPYSTPIPTLPFVVLCLMIFGEFSSAGVAGPFLFFMIDDFGVGGESEVGFWAGIVSAVFFFAQFLTSLLWASVAQKHGRRSVLLVSLVGNAASLILFGMSTNLPMAISVRLAQGLFNGAVGVAKGAVRDLTDETNEGRAYAIMGFCWGMGGIIGPITGGLLEHPAKKFPALFGDSERFNTYPYLLPCIVAASFTATGAVLSLFLGPDGGARTGAIQLPEKVDVERATSHVASNMGSIGRNASKRLSGYFGARGSSAGPDGPSSPLSLARTNTQATNDNSGFPRTFTQQVDFETGGPPSPAESEETFVTRTGTEAADVSGFDTRSQSHRPYAFSRTSARQRGVTGGGSAYGYDRRMSRASAANSAFAPSGLRTQSMVRDRNARNSFSSANQYAPDFEDLGSRPELSFAQRFLLANDDAVFSITDLWVAAAINGDESYSEEVFEDDEEEEEEELVDDDADASATAESIDAFGYGETPPNEDSPLLQPRYLPPLRFAQRKLSRGGRSDAGASGYSRPGSARRTSGSYRVPSIYSNVGVEAPLSPSLMPPMPSANRVDGPAQGYDRTLAGIPELHSTRNSMHASPSAKMPGAISSSGAPGGGLADSAPAAAPSIWSLLPLVVIAHYGLMSFHSATFEQVFMAFLVTPEQSGGLGLTAAHFAELIAAMAFCQMYFQFVFYPKVGPPQGKFSHLAMMRIGLAIYLPCYILFPFLRYFLHPSTDATVMTGMILFASVRWLANVTAFTAATVLMNAMTPPHLIPMANGLAQTVSSAARFVGPIVGGVLWAKGIEGGPNAHPYPFNYALGFWVVGLCGLAGFLHSWTIR